MAANALNRVVNVQISLSALTPTMPSFNIPLLASSFLMSSVANNPFTTRTRMYGSLAAMATDGWSPTAPAYLMAEAVFTQNPSVQNVMIGRKETGADGTETWTQALAAILLENPNFYTVTVDDTTLADQILIAAWVESNQKLCLLRTGDVFNVERSFLTTTITGSTTSAAATVTGISSTASLEVGDGVSGTGIPPGTTILTINSSTEITLSQNATATGTPTLTITASDLSAQLATAKYNRSGAVYHALVGTGSDPYLDSAWFGKALPNNPGSITFAYKQLAGVPADGSLTESSIENLLAKYGSVYTSIAGVNVTQYGRVGSGNPLDLQWGIDWLQARIQNRIYTLLVNSGKVPFTDSGILGACGEIKGALNEGAQNNFVDPTTIVVTPPAASSFTGAQKATRALTGITFSATLTGAIETVTIQGTLVP